MTDAAKGREPAPDPPPDLAAEGAPPPARPLLPAWLGEYRRDWIVADLIAGGTLAAYLLPAGIGDASLAGLPPEAGLYACLLSGLVYWAFSGSRHTAITVTSAISLIVGSTLGSIAGGDAARHAALASGTALIVAGLAGLAWLLRAGVIVNFVSETVLVGFKCGIALHLASTQLPKLFGFGAAHGNFWERMGHFVKHLGETNPTSLAVGGGALAILILGKLFWKKVPVALIVVVGGIALGATLNLSGKGVALLGAVPQGFPSLGLPAVAWSDVDELIPLALACFVLGAVESAAIGRMFARKHGYRYDGNRELLALAASNLGAGLGHAYPVSGGMSQSLVNESSGARSPVSGLVAAMIMLLVTVFLSGLLASLPKPVLAAVVIVAVAGLVKIDALKHLFSFSRAEFAIAMVALVGVLSAGLLKGVLLGAALSILILLRRASAPRVTELGRAPGTSYFADRARHPENRSEPGVLIVRPEGSLVYFNVEHVGDRFMELLEARVQGGEEIKVAVLFLGLTPAVDLAGAELLAELFDTLERRGIALRLAEAHGRVRDALRRGGFESRHGPVEANQPVETVLSEWRARSGDRKT